MHSMIRSLLPTRWFKAKSAVPLRKEARAEKHAEKVKAKEKAESHRAELELLMI